jgi:opacity protein-like surface antigen
MKTRVALLISLLLVSVASFSQTEKGSFYLSGISSLTFSRTVSTVFDQGASDIESSLDINTFNIRSEFGYFLAKDLALGLAIDYTYSKNFKTSEPDVTKETLLMPCLMYVIPLKSSLRPYAQIGAGLISAKVGESTEEVSFFGFAFAGMVGAKYFFNETFALDLGVQLSSAQLSSDEDDLDLDTQNLTAGIGFSFYF